MYKPPKKLHMNKIEKIGAKIAMNQGLTFGIGALVFITIFGILFSGGLLGIIGIGALLSYNYLIISLGLLYISFPFALWFFGKRNSRNIINGKSKIKTSAEFSFGVNLIIWSVFLFSQLVFGGFEETLYLKLVTLGMIIIFGILTTGTLGLYIVKLTADKIKACT